MRRAAAGGTTLWTLSLAQVPRGMSCTCFRVACIMCYKVRRSRVEYVKYIRQVPCTHPVEIMYVQYIRPFFTPYPHPASSCRFSIPETFGSFARRAMHDVSDRRGLWPTEHRTQQGRSGHLAARQGLRIRTGGRSSNGTARCAGPDPRCSGLSTIPPRHPVCGGGSGAAGNDRAGMGLCAINQDRQNS